MKKTLITLLAFALVPVASAWQLTHYSEGNTTGIANSDYSATNGSFTMTLVLDWDKASTLLNNWQDPTHVVTGAQGQPDNYYWNNSFTIFRGVDGYGTNTGNLHIGLFTDTLKGEKSGDTDTDFYTKVQNSSMTINGVTVDSEGNNLTLTKSDFCINGQVALTYSFDSADKSLTMSILKKTETEGVYTLATVSHTTTWSPNIAFDYVGFKANDSMSDATLPDGVVKSFYIYNTALSDAQIISISSAQIPEPTTATLSLLALAGLAARRRRK